MKATYSKYKDTNISWLPQLPEHWILSRVKNHFTFPKNVAGENFLNYKVLSLSIYGVIIRDMESGKGKFSLSMDTYQVVNPNSIILCLFDMDVTPRIVGYCNDLGIITSAYTIILPKENICAKYYYYYFLTQDHNKSLFAQGTGVRTTLTNFQFGSLALPLPPMEEQAMIANYLDAQDEKINLFIAKKQKLIALLKEQKQAIVNKYLHSDLPTIKLKFLIKGKLKYGANESGEEYNEAFPRYIRITDFGANGNLKDEGKLSLKPEVAENYLLKDGDVLFARSGGTVGKTFQFKYADNSFVACFAGYLIKAEPDTKKILSDFLFYFTQSGIYERWKDAIFNKATIENIGADKYSQLLVPVPPVEEQRYILAAIKEETGNIDEVIMRTEKEIELIKEYLQSIIAEVVTGKIKVAN